MIKELVIFLTTLIESIGYPGLIVAIIMETIIAPIPSGAILPFAGFLASEGSMNFYILVILGGVSSYIGTVPFYFLGRAWNRDQVETFIEKYGKFFFVELDEVKKAFNMFDKFNKPLITFGRLIPIIRSVISIPAGIAKMNFLQFTIYTILGSTTWSLILITSGYFLGQNWETVGKYLDKYENVVYTITGLVVGVYIGFKIYKKLQAKNIVK